MLENGMTHRYNVDDGEPLPAVVGEGEGVLELVGVTVVHEDMMGRGHCHGPLRATGVE